MQRSKDYKKAAIFALTIAVLFVPVLASAVDIVPCGGYVLDQNGNKTGDQPPCDFNMFMKLVNNLINWIIMISIPVAAGVFAWAGFLYMTTGIKDQKTKAKDMLWKVFWGFVFILAAWIIVNTITNTLLKPSFRESVPVQGTKK